MRHGTYGNVNFQGLIDRSYTGQPLQGRRHWRSVENVWAESETMLQYANGRVHRATF